MFTTSISASSIASSCSGKSLSAFVSDVAAAKRIGDLTNAAMAARRARSRPALQKAEEMDSEPLCAFVVDVAASERLPELTSVATAARRARARPALQASTFNSSASSQTHNILAADIAASSHLIELKEAATAARRARSRPIYHDGPAKSVPAASQTPEPMRVKYGYACQTMPTRISAPLCRELEELEVIVFPAPERKSSTLVRMETMLEDLKTNGLNAEVIRRNFNRSG